MERFHDSTYEYQSKTIGVLSLEIEFKKSKIWATLLYGKDVPGEINPADLQSRGYKSKHYFPNDGMVHFGLEIQNYIISIWILHVKTMIKVLYSLNQGVIQC